MNKRRLAVGLAAVGFVVSAVVACGSGRPGLADEGNGGPVGMVTTGGSYRVGPCSTEGEKVACDVETGRVGNIVNCFNGTQVCENGKWSPCGGTEVKVQSVNLATFADAIHPLTVTVTGPSSSASGCLQNPCNPNCLGDDVDAGALTPGSFTITGSILGTVSDPSSFPAGVTGPKAAASDGVASPTAHFVCDPGHPPSSYLDCSYDYCCASSGTYANTCQPWVVTGADNGNASTCVKTTNPDLELGLGCKNLTDSSIHVPVCNRGTNNVQTSGTLTLGFYSGNPTAAGTIGVCYPNANNPSSTCTIDLSKFTLATDGCIDINVTAGTAGTATGYTCNGVPTGETTMMINPPTMVSLTTASETGTTATVYTGTTNSGYVVGNRVFVTGVAGASTTVTAAPTGATETGTTATIYTGTTSSGVSVGTNVTVSGVANSAAITSFPSSSTASTGATETLTTARIYTGASTLGAVAGNTVTVAGVTNSTISSTGTSETGTTVTFKTGTVYHGFQTGNSVTIAGVSVAGYNGTFVVTGTGGSGTNANPYTFTYTALSSGLAAGTAGTATVSATGYNGTYVVTGAGGSGTSANPYYIEYTAVAGLPKAGGGTVTATTAGYNGTFAVTAIGGAGTNANPYYFQFTTTAGLGAAGGGTVSGAVSGYNGKYTITAIGGAGTNANPYYFQFATTAGLAAGSGGQAVSAPISEGDYCNNYSFLPNPQQNAGICQNYGVQPPAAVSSAFQYTMACPTGTTATWNQFAYDATPNTGAAGADYDITFSLASSGGTSAGVTKSFHAKNLSNYPASCAFSATTTPACTATPPADSPCNTAPVAPATTYTCPVNLGTLLGTNKNDKTLTLSLNIAPGATTSPVLNSWALSYSCIPTE